MNTKSANIASKANDFDKVFGKDATLLRSKWSQQLQETAVDILHNNVEDKKLDEHKVIIFYKSADGANKPTSPLS